MRRCLLPAVLLTASVMIQSAGAQNSCSKNLAPKAIDGHIDTIIRQMTIDERIEQLQDRAPAIPRLGIHAYNWWNEGLHGLARDGYATVFPQAIGLAATWDAELLHSVGDTVATEARAKFSQHARYDSPRYGGLTLWSPNINIFRDPRWGRGQETYGEDPFLTATLGTNFVQGVQGNDAFYLKANATPKHFVAHSGPEQGRDSFNAKVSPHDLADTYLPAFHEVTTQGKAAALMCSYNAISGTPSCANSSLLQARVRDLWHFNGYVVSDCDAVGNITEYQHYTADAAHGTAAALNAGVDLDCGSSYLALKQAYAQKLVTEETINRSLHRLLLARFRLGMMDPLGCSPYDSISKSDLDTTKSRALALRAAEESVVLLHNDGTLPIKSSEQRIAVVGPTANMLKVLEANYHGTASQGMTPLEGLRESFKTVQYAQGSLLAPGVTAPIPDTAFHIGVEQHSLAGLVAEYFPTTSISGEPLVTSIVDNVDLDLDRVGPDPKIVTPHYSARWHGYFFPPAAGDYTIRVNMERCWDCTAHDHFRLFLDGKLQIKNNSEKFDTDRVKLHFADTAPHEIKLELEHIGEDEGIALEWEPPADALLNEAVAAARDADSIIAFVGLSPDLEGEALQVHLDGFAGGDRTSLDLPAAQMTLLKRLAELRKPLVVVLTSGSAVSLDPGKIGASALLEAWYPGEEAGHAIANILTGRANPSGRLPVTFYRGVADLPAFDDYSMSRRTYRYFSGPVLYPFGYGLSYTLFTYGVPHLGGSTLAAGKPLDVTVRISNTGKVAGTEVVELYLAPPQFPGAPHLALAGIQRVDLGVGKSREITFTVDPAHLSFVDAQGHRSIRPGLYRLFIGGAQPDLAVNTGVAFTIAGTKSMDF
ncbi:beta-glucosidase [Granulicella aggregans]|uniref:Beta-glucosidase n=1 Tax=Granulicella aggregans TaxID=474949 RepID=A0A7W7Z9X0_9BACT|nr:glycoside hydrolase family 3 C-terminal domain-containing protein [Granulicella aggregans]MBB5055975.1 beta-glucosidase [Granulicella aggregans]